MQFVIWGFGRNGRILYEILGTGRITAYIDSNEKFIGTSYKGIPVITLEQYQKVYKKYPIIISAMDYTGEISSILLNNGIRNFYSYKQDYARIWALYLQANPELLEAKYDNGKRIVVIGTGLYAVLLYNYFHERGYDCCIYEDSICSDMSKYFKISTVGKKEAVCADYLLCAGTLSGMDRQVLIDAKGIIEDYNQIRNWKYLFYHPDLKRYENLHRGERCFIVATGPSLRVEDLNKLAEYGEYCIGVNGIFKIYGQTKWRPDYYIISDQIGMLQWRENIESMENVDCFVADLAYFFDERFAHIHKWHMQLETGDCTLPQFTQNFSEVSFCGDTITYDGALQLAVYMGFSRIYMIGTDCCQYPYGEKQHFLEDYQNEEFKDAKIHVDKQMLAYQSAKSYAMRNGIKIFNATRGGQLEVFERMDFDSLF